MSWTDLSAAFADSTLLPSSSMQSLRDNLSAIFNANSGAPQFCESAYTTNCVNSSHLADALQKRLVTNGDSHTHAGRLTNSSFAANLLTNSHLNLELSLWDEGYISQTAVIDGFMLAVFSSAYSTGTYAKLTFDVPTFGDVPAQICDVTCDSSAAMFFLASQGHTNLTIVGSVYTTIYRVG